MQAKSSRGVQQDDVWGAADALLAEGLRPTIERVRLKIGRGSPNTVSPLLEGWFATLGRRLGAGNTSQGEEALPAPVFKAASNLWEIAMASAQEEAVKALSSLQQIVADDRAALELRETDVIHQKQVLKERQEAFDDALKAARIQVADLTQRLAESVVERGERDREIGQLRAAVIALEKHRETARQQSDEQGKKHAEERIRLEERASASERRMLTELDRERQETKRAKASLDEVQRAADASKGKLFLATQSLTDKLNESNAELALARQALSVSEERSAELLALLASQRSIPASERKQPNLRRATPERKKTALSLTRRRRP